MRTSLFDRVSFERLGERHASVTGAVEIHRCERLRELSVTQGDESVRIEATVATHPHGVHLSGRVAGEITVACRRCLGPVTLCVDRPLNLVVVGSETAMQAVPESEEVHFAPDLTGRLVDVLEEEVLLDLPDFPAHREGDCIPAALPTGVDEVEQAEAQASETPPTQRPFAAALRGMATKPEDQ